VFKATSSDDGILLYNAYNSSGFGDFVALSIRDQHIVFQFDTGAGQTSISDIFIFENLYFTIYIQGLQNNNKTVKMELLYISQGSVVTQLRCAGIFNNRIIASFPQNVPVKEFWKSVNLFKLQSGPSRATAITTLLSMRRNRAFQREEPWIGVSPHHPTTGLRERRKLPQRGPGQSSAEN